MIAQFNQMANIWWHRWLEKETWGCRKRKLATALVSSLIIVVGMMPTAGFSQDNLPDEDGVYQLDEVDIPPRVTSAFPPQYPIEAKENGLTGRVVVEFVVTTEGLPRDEWVVKAEPPGVFEDASFDAVRQYRFTPAIRNGEPVEARVKLPIVFELDVPDPAEDVP